MLLQGNCVKRVLGETSLSLEAKAGESFLVNRIDCKANSADEYLVLRVDRKTVGVYRAYGRAGSHLQCIGSPLFPLNLMDFLTKQDVNISIPVAEGQTFSIDNINAATEIVVTYDTYSAGDITAVMPNGSESKEYTFMQYMTSTADSAASGDLLLDVSLSPSEFIDFPCGKVVPAKTAVRMLGLVGNTWHDGGSSGDRGYTTFVKLVKDRETLFDTDRNGIPFRGRHGGSGYNSYIPDFSLIGGVYTQPDYAYTPADEAINVGKPLMFNPALEFVSGEELLVYLTCVFGTARKVGKDDIDLAAILHVKVE